MGIMGGKNKIVNIKLKGMQLLTIKKILATQFKIKNIRHVNHVVEGKPVFEIILRTPTRYRLDIYETSTQEQIDLHKKRMYYQNIAYNNDVHVPKIIGFYKDDGMTYKISEWAVGERIGFYWDDPELFKKAGIEIAKINLIKDPKDDCFLGYNDFTKPNAIWTRTNEISLIDAIIESKKDVDQSVVKILYKNLECDMKRVKWFLEGYDTIRNSKRIQKLLGDIIYKEYPEEMRDVMVKHEAFELKSESIHKTLSKWIKHSEKKVIEVGCGYGTFAKVLESKGINGYIGIDNNPQMIDVAKKECPHYKFFNSNIEDAYFIMKKASTLLLLDTLHCIHDGPKLLNNILPGTNVIISTTNSNDEIEEWIMKLVDFLDIKVSITAQDPDDSKKRTFLFKTVRNDYVNKETNEIFNHVNFDMRPKRPI